MKVIALEKLIVKSHAASGHGASQPSWLIAIDNLHLHDIVQSSFIAIYACVHTLPSCSSPPLYLVITQLASMEATCYLSCFQTWVVVTIVVAKKWQLSS